MMHARKKLCGLSIQSDKAAQTVATRKNARQTAHRAKGGLLRTVDRVGLTAAAPTTGRSTGGLAAIIATSQISRSPPSSICFVQPSPSSLIPHHIHHVRCQERFRPGPAPRFLCVGPPGTPTPQLRGCSTAFLPATEHLNGCHWQGLC